MTVSIKYKQDPYCGQGQPQVTSTQPCPDTIPRPLVTELPPRVRAGFSISSPPGNESMMITDFNKPEQQRAGGEHTARVRRCWAVPTQATAQRLQRQPSSLPAGTARPAPRPPQRAHAVTDFNCGKGDWGWALDKAF